MQSCCPRKGSLLSALEQRDGCQQRPSISSVPDFMETDTTPTAHELTAIHGSELFILSQAQQFNAHS